MKRHADRSGELLHAKHTLKPNSLGYCGPDENANILEHLRTSSTGERLRSTLSRFEAAYPFIRMIAASTGREVFDYDVTEAYWIGNPLLEKVSPAQFFEFTHRALGSRITKEDAKELFGQLGSAAKPHHTFYVLGIYGRSDAPTSDRRKLVQIMDSCRVSWGRVGKVKEKTLLVEREPLVIRDGLLSLSRQEEREVTYDREVAPFATVARGDWVSIHWNSACEVLTKYQLKNISAYTAVDLEAANRFGALPTKERHSDT